MKSHQQIEEYQHIAELINAYYDALYRCDVDGLKAVFHPQAVYATVIEGQLRYLDMPSYYTIVAQRESPAQRNENYGYTVQSIDVAGESAACVRLSSTMMGHDYVDFINLLKLDDRWVIIAKVFNSKVTTTN